MTLINKIRQAKTIKERYKVMGIHYEEDTKAIETDNIQDALRAIMALNNYIIALEKENKLLKEYKEANENNSNNSSKSDENPTMHQFFRKRNG